MEPVDDLGLLPCLLIAPAVDANRPLRPAAFKDRGIPIAARSRITGGRYWRQEMSARPGGRHDAQGADTDPPPAARHDFLLSSCALAACGWAMRIAKPQAARQLSALQCASRNHTFFRD